MAEDQAIVEARIRALFERRCELIVKGQELCLELSRVDLDIVRAGASLPAGAIAGTIGATVAGTIGATIAGTIGAAMVGPAAAIPAATPQK